MKKLFLIILLSLSVIMIKNNIIPKDIGLTNGMFKELPGTDNCVSTQTADMDKYIEPIGYVDDVIKSKSIIIEILNNIEGAEIMAVEEDYIHAVFKSKLFRFKDDVEIYFGELIHYRSESRIGISDLGVNRKRFELIKKIYMSW